MITLDILIATEIGFERADIENWIAQGWVRAEGGDRGWAFDEIDVARLHLIRTLRHDYRIEEDALAVMLRLLDQLYDQRRRLRRLCNALARTASPELHAALRAAMLEEAGGEDAADDGTSVAEPG